MEIHIGRQPEARICRSAIKPETRLLVDGFLSVCRQDGGSFELSGHRMVGHLSQVSRSTLADTRVLTPTIGETESTVLRHRALPPSREKVPYTVTAPWWFLNHFLRFA
jgi:hypothetical protein